MVDGDWQLAAGGWRRKDSAEKEEKYALDNHLTAITSPLENLMANIQVFWLED